MRPFDEYKDLISLKEMNRQLAEELEKVIRHITDTAYHVTVEDRRRWDNKLDVISGGTATRETNGLMSAEDKLKLDGIEYSANFYEHPKVGLEPGTYNSVTVDRYGHVVAADTVTDVDNAHKLGGRPASEYALITSPVFRGTPVLVNTPTENDTNAVVNVKFVKEYVNGITFGDLGITIDDINNWNAKWDANTAPLATQSAKGAMSAIDKTRLDNLVTLFSSTSATDISNWNNSITLDDIPLATPLDNGLMSAADKEKLNGLTPCEYCPTLEDVTRWDAKWDAENAPIATTSNAGIISIEDRQFLDKLVPASNITETDIRNWNNKLDQIAVATSSTDGLMSANDKAKLDNLAENDQSITAEDIQRWNNKQDKLNPASITEAGTMSAEDKRRLDDMYLSYESTLRKITDVENQLSDLRRTVTGEHDGLMSIEDKNRLDALYSKYNDAVAVTQESVNKWNGYENEDCMSITQEDIDRWNESMSPQTLFNLIIRMQAATNRIDSLEDHVQWKEYTDEEGNPIDPPVPMEETVYNFNDVERLLEIMDIIEDRVANLEEHAVMHDLRDEEDILQDNTPNPDESNTNTTTDPEDEEGTRSLFDDTSGEGTGEDSTIDGPNVGGSTEPMIEEEGEF